jgi:hypothetical protein
LTAAQRSEILRLAARHGARDVRVFGSFARDEAGPSSDLDLLVAFEADRTKGRCGDRRRPHLVAPAPNPGRSTSVVIKDPRVYLAHILESPAVQELLPKPEQLERELAGDEPPETGSKG